MTEFVRRELKEQNLPCYKQETFLPYTFDHTSANYSFLQGGKFCVDRRKQKTQALPEQH